MKDIFLAAGAVCIVTAIGINSYAHFTHLTLNMLGKWMECPGLMASALGIGTAGLAFLGLGVNQ